MKISEDQLGEFYIEYDDVKAYEADACFDEDGNEKDITTAMMSSIREYWSGRLQSLDRVKEIFGL